MRPSRHSRCDQPRGRPFGLARRDRSALHGCPLGLARVTARPCARDRSSGVGGDEDGDGVAAEAALGGGPDRQRLDRLGAAVLADRDLERPGGLAGAEPRPVADPRSVQLRVGARAPARSTSAASADPRREPAAAPPWPRTTYSPTAISMPAGSESVARRRPSRPRRAGRTASNVTSGAGSSSTTTTRPWLSRIITSWMAWADQLVEDPRVAVPVVAPVLPGDRSVVAAGRQVDLEADRVALVEAVEPVDPELRGHRDVTRHGERHLGGVHPGTALVDPHLARGPRSAPA